MQRQKNAVKINNMEYANMEGESFAFSHTEGKMIVFCTEKEIDPFRTKGANSSLVRCRAGA